MDKVKDYTIYDETELYKEKLEPLIKEVRKVCRLHNIPFFCSVAVKNGMGDKGEMETKYENNGVFTGSSNVVLVNDLFTKYLLINRGAEIAPLTKNEQLDEMISEYMNETEE